MVIENHNLAIAKLLIYGVNFNDDGHTLVDMTVMAINKIHSHAPCLRQNTGREVDLDPGDLISFGMNLRVDSP